MTVPYEMRKVQAVGNGRSVNMVIPKYMAQSIGVGKGDYVKLSINKKKGQIIIEAIETNA